LLQACPPERRDWEWHYLVRRCQGNYRESSSGGAFVLAIAYSPDGKYLATAAAESITLHPRMLVRIWRTDTLEILHTLHPADLISEINQVWRCKLVFTPDSNELFATGFRADNHSTGYVKRWTVLTGTESPLPHGSFPSRQVMELPLHPDGFVRALTAPIELGAEPQMQLELVDLKTGVRGQTIRQPANSVATAGHYFDADTFLLQHNDLEKIDLNSGDRTWRQAIGSASALAVDSTKQWGAIVSELGDLTLVDLATGAKTYTRHVHRNAIEGVAFHPKERVLATLGYDGVIRVANIDDGNEVRKLTGLRESPFLLTFDPTGEQIATDGLPEGRIAIWRWKGEKALSDLGGIINLAVADKLLAVAEQQGYVSVWSTDTWKLERKIPSNSRLPVLNTTAIDPQGKLLATGDGHFRQPDAPGQVKLWNLQTGELLHTFPPAAQFIHSVQFSPDGKTLGWSGGKRVVLCDLEDKQEIFSLPVNAPRAAFAFRPGSHEIVISDFDERTEQGVLYVVDSQTGSKLRDLASPADSPTKMFYGPPQFSDDGRWLLAGAGNGRGATRVIRWDADKWTVAQTYMGGFMEVGAPVMSPNGRRIFACFWDGSVAVWDTESGEEVLHIVDAEHQLYALELLPDGRLIAGGFEGTLHRWDGRAAEGPAK
jgi:WD40 repeat protein